MNRLAIFASVLLSVVPSSAQSENSVISDILVNGETKLGIKRLPKTSREAIDNRDIELHRLDYSRTVQLYGEGIGAARDMEEKRAEYEKALIQATANRCALSQTLNVLDTQRAMISKYLSRQIAERQKSLYQ